MSEHVFTNKDAALGRRRHRRRPFLNPAFVVEVPPTRLDGTGAWQIAGEAEDGRVLFSRHFEMAEMADGDGRQSFALALPTESSWADALSRIVLTGRDGSVTMDAQSGPAAALLRDPATGRVRGILRDWSRSGAAAQADRGRALPAQRGPALRDDDRRRPRRTGAGRCRSRAWRSK